MIPGALHMVAPFHTHPAASVSHCAFTGKVLRFPAMMKGSFERGIIEYANAGSESVADEHVVMLSKKEMARYYPREKKDFWGNHAQIGSLGWLAFHQKLIREMSKRMKDGDFIAHPFGAAHRDGLVEAFPDGPCHVETGIGYPDPPHPHVFRIFESEAWKNYHWGKHGEDVGYGTEKNYTFVVPNYYNETEWPYGAGQGGYVLFMGRITAPKGLNTLIQVIKAWFLRHPTSKLRFKFAGQGAWGPVHDALGDLSKECDYLGPVSGTKRAPLTGNALCSVMPTDFIEPFGGSGVEGMLTGTPLLAVDWGAFTETVIQGVTGYRCTSIGEWLTALEIVHKLDRKRVAAIARERYSYEACRKLYTRAFIRLRELWRGPGFPSTTDTLLR